MEVRRSISVTESSFVSPVTYRRRRTVAGGITVVLASAFAMGAATFGERNRADASSSKPKEARCATYYVQPGDTEWGIAKNVNPKRDPREGVKDLEVDNGLKSGATLFAGKRLIVCKY